MNNPTINSFLHILPEPVHYNPRYACLPQGRVKSYADLEGETVHCLEGRLWVTFEGDSEDHILLAGERVEVPNPGKLLISGPGCYRISRGIDGLDLAQAS